MARIPPNHVNVHEEPVHAGLIRIGRTHGGGFGERETHVTINITDKNSGVALFEGKMEMEDFANCLMGLSNLPIAYKLRGEEYVGMVEEHKEITVPVYAPEHDQRAQVAFDAAQPYCVDGWMYAGPQRDAGRGASWTHRDWNWFTNPMGTGPGLTNYTVRLKFIRYVRPQQDQPTTRTRVRVRRPDNT